MDPKEFKCDIYFMETTYLAAAPDGKTFITLLTAMPDQVLDGLSEEDLRNTYFSKLILWDGKTGEMLYDFSKPDTYICQAEFISSSILVYADHDGNVMVFDIEKREFTGAYHFDCSLISSALEKRFCYHISDEHEELISFCEKKGLIAYSLKSGNLSVYNTNSGENYPNLITKSKTMKHIYVAFDQGSSNSVKVFDEDTGCELYTIEGFGTMIMAIHVLEELKYIVVFERYKTTVWSHGGKLLYKLNIDLSGQNYEFIDEYTLIVLKEGGINIFQLPYSC